MILKNKVDTDIDSLPLIIEKGFKFFETIDKWVSFVNTI